MLCHTYLKHHPESWHNLASEEGQREQQLSEVVWDREEVVGTTQSSFTLRKHSQAQEKLELYQMAWDL